MTDSQSLGAQSPARPTASSQIVDPTSRTRADQSADHPATKARRLHALLEIAGRPWERVHLATIFLVLGAVSGFAFVALNPPLQAFDETQHYERAYQLSTWNLFSDKVHVRAPDGKMEHGYGGRLPQHLVDVMTQTTAGNDNVKSTYRYDVVRQLWESPPRGDRQVPMRFDNTALYSPVAYAPEVAGILLARASGMPDIGQIYAARAAELVLWLLLMWSAIRIAPVGREIFFVLALNPLAVWQATTMSPDAMGAGLLALSVAILLRLRTPMPVAPRPSPASLALVLVLAIVAACTIKVSYLPMAALPLFIPDQVWRRTWRLLAAAAAFAVATAWHLAVMPASAGIPQFHNLTNGVVNSHQQIDYILHHVPRFVASMIWNVVGTNSVFWGDDYVGQLSWTALPRWVPYAWTAALVYAIAVKRPQLVTESWRRSKATITGLVAIAGVSALMVVGALFVGWTYVGSDVVMGIQRRYWISLSFLAIPLFLTVRPYFDGRRKHLVLGLGAAVMLATAVLTVFLDYQGYTV